MPITREARIAYFLLRAGVAFAFLYPPINALQDPNSWLGYFPPFVLGWGEGLGIPPTAVLNIFGVAEVIIALWLLSGWKIFLPSLAAAAMLLGIVAFNTPQFQVVFRDLSLAAVALALALMNKPVTKVE